MTSKNEKNSNYKSSEQDGISIKLRISQTLIAVMVSSGLSFTAGASVNNSFNQTQINNCTLGQATAALVPLVSKALPSKEK